jgi:hypothetical protein
MELLCNNHFSMYAHEHPPSVDVRGNVKKIVKKAAALDQESRRLFFTKI